jgi:voltage-gated potassium channel
MSRQPPEVGGRGHSWSRATTSFVGLLAAYYAFPIEWAGHLALAIGLTVSVGGLALVASAMVSELTAVRRGDPGRGIRVLSMLLVLLIMASSLTFFLLSQARPQEFAGLETRTDALYFTLSTMSTVGFGDVHAEGQAARVLVCLLIVFNVVVVASLARAYAAQSVAPR